MPTARNDITGDLIKTKPSNSQYEENYEKIFGNKAPERGKFIFDEELRKFVPAEEWYANHYEERNQAPMAFVDNMEAYESPVTGEAITNRRKRDYDLKANGCRPYEGFKSENMEAQKYRQEQKQKLNSNIRNTLEKTYYEIEHGYRRLED